MHEKSANAARLDIAYEKGRQAGLCGQAQPGECPFTRETLDLRIAWLDGFSDGQWEGTGSHASCQVRSAFFGSGIANVVCRPHRV